MIAKKHPSPDAGHAAETRKVDSMSELVAGMLLDEPDATSPPPEESPGSLSAVRAMEPRSSRPLATTLEESRSPGLARAVVIALILALVVLAVVAVILFSA
jgi:hypothetical protein